MAFELGGMEVAAGSRRTVDLPVSALSNHIPVTLPVHVVHGRLDGPVMFISAAIHGDEVLGVEIIRRVLNHPAMRRMAGTLLAVPIVNAYGFINHSRYLPDRRDLNRSFPGSDQGSLASVLANIFMREVVLRSSVGIDLHTAALHRSNLPQMRITPGRPVQRELAEVFAPPAVIVSSLRERSLRMTALNNDVDVVLFEAGEALRFDEIAIRAGVFGTLRVMKHLGMLNAKSIKPARVRPVYSHESHWQRAPQGGIFRAYRTTGDVVGEGNVIGIVSDPFGEAETEVRAPYGGVIIGRTNLPVVNRGDALFHIAVIDAPEQAEQRLGAISGELEAAKLFDEDEIL
jgi:predicted deacylase